MCVTLLHLARGLAGVVSRKCNCELHLREARRRHGQSPDVLVVRAVSCVLFAGHL